MLDASSALLASMAGRARRQPRVLAGRIATVVLLAGVEGELRKAAVNGLVHGQFGVDQDFILSLYRSSSRAIRPSLAAAVPVSYLRPTEYRRVWNDALRAARSDKQRLELARTLDGFLARNPGEASDYAAPVHRFLASKHVELHGVGLLLMASLPWPNPSDIQQAASALASENAFTLLCGLGTVQRWLVRAEAVGPGALALARSDTAIAAARRAQRHNDAAVRVAAGNYFRILRRRGAARKRRDGVVAGRTSEAPSRRRG